jgi:hypothetical protein
MLYKLLYFLKFQKVLARQESVFFGEGISGFFHVPNDLLSGNQMVFGEAEFA